MQVHEDLSSFPDLNFPVVTSGTFDGVHLGHQKIINQVINEAKNQQGESVLITFDPHPRQILFPEDKSLRVITPFEHKVKMLDKLGIDHLLKIKFSREFSQKSSLEFIDEILLNTINTKLLVIGYDHRFGKNREGGFEYLQKHAPKFGFEVLEIPRQDIDNLGISSTKIREALMGGNISKANAYLGRNYQLKGKVVAGNKIGREIGYPTANIEPLETLQMIPTDGIYAVFVEYRQHIFKGMLSIGIRPTIGDSTRTIEVNIFDFKADIYNQELNIFFVEKYREEEKFDSLEALKEQLHADFKKANDILSQHPLQVL